MKSLLIIDCGHSRTKFHAYKMEGKQHLSVENTPFKWPDDLDPKDYDECLVMGTNERMIMRWLSHWKQNGGVTPMILGKDCRVPIEKRCGSGTGNDRMVHALGVKAKYPKDKVLIVSAGSALVIDIVEKGVLIGGLIGLGWKNYCETMKKLNANLITTDEPVTYPGMETDQAVSLGWLTLVEASIQQLSLKHAIDHMVFTGGDAEKLQKKYPKAEVDPLLGIDALAGAFGYHPNL